MPKREIPVFPAISRRAILAAPLALLAGLSLALAETATVTFLHVNDIYEISPREGSGGFAQLMTAVKRERARAPEAILTFGGDLFSSSMMSGITRGEQMVELTNAVAVQVAAVGNHEFDFGPEMFKQRVAQSRFPWLAANIQGADGKVFGGAKATTILRAGDLKIGFFGLLTPSTQRTSSPGPSVTFVPTAEAAAAAVRQLKDDGADVIVALTHLALTEDHFMLRSTPGVHLLLGGHEHDLITDREGEVLIQKSGVDARLLSVVELAVEISARPGGGKDVRVRPALRVVPVRDLVPDPEIAAIVKKWEDRFESELEQPVGTVAAAMDSRRQVVRYRESVVGNLIADATREGLKADAAILNGGGIRGDKVYEAGAKLTRRDVLGEVPFGNIGVMVEMSGAALREAVEQGLYTAGRGGGGFPQVSGLAFRYDPDRDRGDRVTQIAVGGMPLDPAALYRVATNDYMLGGGDGYAAFGKGRVVVDASAGQPIATLVIAYIASRGTVSPKLEGRIIAGR
ncbi:MAG: bifunctional metallophosphatase/5'-nucleotidase [Rhodospirillaceae bacterium]|nr:bifunctional metallophosphatase/5'-nucleotidase [Rhodospirillaceae bacterium]